MYSFKHFMCINYTWSSQQPYEVYTTIDGHAEGLYNLLHPVLKMLKGRAGI